MPNKDKSFALTFCNFREYFLDRFVTSNMFQYVSHVNSIFSILRIVTEAPRTCGVNTYRICLLFVRPSFTWTLVKFGHIDSKNCQTIRVYNGTFELRLLKKGRPYSVGCHWHMSSMIARAAHSFCWRWNINSFSEKLSSYSFILQPGASVGIIIPVFESVAMPCPPK